MAETVGVDYSEKIKRFFKTNISTNITRYILGSTALKWADKVPRYPAYFERIFSLAFIFAYSCLRYDNDNDGFNAKFSSQNALRIVDSLNKAYVQHQVSSELIRFVLSDIQFEMMQSNDSDAHEVFGRLCDFRKLPCTLARYYKVIADWKDAPSKAEGHEEELQKMFLDLLRHMTFLSRYDLAENAQLIQDHETIREIPLLSEEDGIFSFVEKDAAEYDEWQNPYALIPARHILFTSDDYPEIHTLYSMEMRTIDDDKELELVYMASDGFTPLHLLVSTNRPEMMEDDDSHIYVPMDAGRYYYSIVGKKWKDPARYAEQQADNAIDHVHAINYTYIKNLALAVSDAISANRGSKSALYNHYHLRYKDIFSEVEAHLARGEDIERIKINWDSIIVMLLIESSASSVLETLFRANRQIFIAVAKNLVKRIDTSEFGLYGKDEDALDDLVDNIIETKIVMGEIGNTGLPRTTQDQEYLRPRAEAKLIVDELTKMHQKSVTEKKICAGNLYDNIALLKNRKDADVTERIQCACIVLGETFRHITCFYRGIVGTGGPSYGNLKMKFDHQPYSSDNKSSDKEAANNKSTIRQEHVYAAFWSAAKAEAAALKEYSSTDYDGIRALLTRFIDLCKECHTDTAMRKRLFAVLGKHDVLNVNEFKGYVDMFFADHSDITAANIDEWTEFTLDLLHYLRKGSFSNVGDSYFKTVYPLAATYNKGKENRDGHHTFTFTLNFDLDGDDMPDDNAYINVLTEFTYDSTYAFYCLPNVIRSNKRWWIDPLLIGFEEFNNIFKE
ncbi:MAG: hypothetical protein IKU51_01200 [Clostridia bacterium]|nr:hypothetical protein [Clostridia bacterium]